MKQHLATLIAITLGIITASSVTTNEIDELKRHFEKAELERKIAEEELKRVQAELPKSDTKPLEGKITAKGLDIEADVLAYGAMRLTARKIAASVSNEVTGKPIFIYQSNDALLLTKYQTIEKAVEALRDRYASLVEHLKPGRAVPGALALTEAQSIIKGVVDLISLFRTDTDIAGQRVTIKDEALIAEVAELLTHSEIYQPSLFPPLLIDPDTLQISKDMGLIQTYRMHIRTNLNAQPASTSPPGTNAPSASTNAPATPTLTAAQKAIAAIWPELESEYSKFQAALFGIRSDGSSLYSEIIRGATLQQHLRDNKGHLLSVSVLSAGGSSVTTRNFFLGTKLKHSGGCVVQYVLVGPDGTVRKSGTHAEYLGYFRLPTKSAKRMPLW